MLGWLVGVCWCGLVCVGVMGSSLRLVNDGCLQGCSHWLDMIMAELVTYFFTHMVVSRIGVPPNHLSWTIYSTDFGVPKLARETNSHHLLCTQASSPLIFRNFGGSQDFEFCQSYSQRRSASDQLVMEPAGRKGSQVWPWKCCIDLVGTSFQQLAVFHGQDLLVGEFRIYFL